MQILQTLFAKVNGPPYEKANVYEHNKLQALYNLLSKFWQEKEIKINTYIFLGVH